MPAEQGKTEDGFSAVVTHASTGKTEQVAGKVPAKPSDTATGLIVLSILAYFLYRFLRRK